jgi:hypothetical protein
MMNFLLLRINYSYIKRCITNCQMIGDRCVRCEYLVLISVVYFIFIFKLHLLTITCVAHRQLQIDNEGHRVQIFTAIQAEVVALPEYKTNLNQTPWLKNRLEQGRRSEYHMFLSYFEKLHTIYDTTSLENSRIQRGSCLFWKRNILR